MDSNLRIYDERTFLHVDFFLPITTPLGNLWQHA